MSVCPYERCDLGNYKSYNTGIRHVDFRDSCATQVCFVSFGRSNAHKPPKILAPTVLMQNLTEMYFSQKCLPIDPKKSLPRPL